MWLRSLLAIGLLTLPLQAQDFAPISGPERAALLALYRSTGGDQWKNRQGWLGPAGSECTWYGVSCGVSAVESTLRNTVWSLELAENHLVGTLPDEMNGLTSLEMLILRGNELRGSLPSGIRERWERGPLRLIGYASQFTAQITEIVLTQRSVAWCGDFVAEIRTNGAVTMRTDRCRERKGQRQPQHYCEVKAGQANRFTQDLDRLASFLESSGFFDLAPEYFRSMTHGGTTIIEVTRAGNRKKVVNFGAYGPLSLWMAERLIGGVLSEVMWESTRETSDCGFKTRDV